MLVEKKKRIRWLWPYFLFSNHVAYAISFLSSVFLDIVHLFPLPRNAVMWIGDSKLHLGVNECVNIWVCVWVCVWCPVIDWYPIQRVFPSRAQWSWQTGSRDRSVESHKSFVSVLRIISAEQWRSEANMWHVLRWEKTNSAILPRKHYILRGKIFHFLESLLNFHWIIKDSWPPIKVVLFYVIFCDRETVVRVV